MKKYRFAALGFLNLLLLCGARVPAETVDFLPNALSNIGMTKVSSNGVSIFYGKKDVPYRFDEVGQFRVRLEFNEALELESTLQMVRRQAAQIGADAIILPRALKTLGLENIRATPKEIEERLSTFPWTVVCVRQKSEPRSVIAAESTDGPSMALPVHLSMQGQKSISVSSKTN